MFFWKFGEIFLGKSNLFFQMLGNYIFLRWFFFLENWICSYNIFSLENLRRLRKFLTILDT